MANNPKKPQDKQDNGIPQMPFDDALKRLMKALPQHKAAKKEPKKK